MLFRKRMLEDQIQCLWEVERGGGIVLPHGLFHLMRMFHCIEESITRAERYLGHEER